MNGFLVSMPTVSVGYEAAVSRLSLEPSVSSITWNVCEPAALVAPEE